EILLVPQRLIEAFANERIAFLAEQREDVGAGRPRCFERAQRPGRGSTQIRIVALGETKKKWRGITRGLAQAFERFGFEFSGDLRSIEKGLKERFRFSERAPRDAAHHLAGHGFVPNV